MRLSRTENGLDHAHFFLLKRKSWLQIENSDRFRMDCRETLQLPEESLSYQHQQIRKARKMMTPNFRYGSSLKWFVERPCGYQDDNLAAGSVRPSHESLQEKLLVSGHEVLHVIDKDAYLKGREIVYWHTWIPIVNTNVALCWAEYTPMDDNIWRIWKERHR